MEKKSVDTKTRIGLIFVKSKFTSEECANESDKLALEKQNEKWIVVAGNAYSTINFEKNHNCKLNTEEGEVKENPRILGHNVLFLSGDHVLDQPLLQTNIVELHLDSVLKDKSEALSLKLFKCVNLRVLSLRHNNMMSLPAEIGRLSKLRTLVLTENCLTSNTIPYTLTFCKQLAELYLDHNLLDALPGFLLEMSCLHTVYRHGNLNYFKSTFMWYHTAERERVMPLRPNRANAKSEETLYQPQSLESHSIKALIGAKINFFIPGLLPATLQDYVAKIYSKYRLCAYCSAAFNESKPGFRVFTFKNPYLGNTCVPFEHWTCSRECGVALEEPAHKQQRAQARQLDKQYEQYVKSVQDQFYHKTPNQRTSTCAVM